METLPLRAGGEMDSIIDRYQNTVYGLALARTGNRADADDVFQEVFLAYCQCGKTFRDEEHRKAWLLRTTINQSRRVTSSSWRQKTVPLSEREDSPVQSVRRKLLTPQAATPAVRQGYRAVYCRTPTEDTSMLNSAAATGVPNTALNSADMQHMVIFFPARSLK